MKISIVMPTFNRAGTISRAINSIINQDYNDFELLIVDDGSQDNTKEIVNSFDDKRIKYIYQKNGGACKARNTGILAASGKYIAFLDSDDEWDKSKLTRQIDFLKSKNADATFCNYYYEKDGKKNIAINDLKKEYIVNDDLLDKNYITTGALLIKKELLVESGMFDEQMPRYQDWELALRLALNNKLYYQNECLLTLHYQAISISNSTSKQKKLIALEKILEKNTSQYKSNKKAYAHIFWSMGMYKLCLNIKDEKMLKIGIFYDKLNIRRLIIYILIKIGFKRIIVKKYSINH